MSESDINSALARHKARNWDGLAALIAALIGVLALLVSGYTAYIQRQQVRAQVWPYLLVGNYDPEQAIGVLNKGVGPAIVHSVQVWVDGKPQRNWKQVLEMFGMSPHGFQDSTISGNVISAGERIVAIKFPEDGPYQHFRSEMRTRGGMEICFCSTLGECWLYSDRAPDSHASQHAIGQCPRLPQAETFDD